MSKNRLPKSSSKPRELEELKLLRAIADGVRKDLHQLEKTVEWLAFASETSRATVRRVFDADSNVGIVTLDRIVRALGYDGIADFFRKR